MAVKAEKPIGMADPDKFNPPGIPQAAPQMVDWDQIEEATKNVVVPDGVYTLQCSPKTAFKATKAGRPAINFLFTIEGEPKAGGIFVMAVLPWHVTQAALDHESYAHKKDSIKAGDFEDSGAFMLKNIGKALKYTGTGKVDIATMIRAMHNKSAKARLKTVTITQGARKGDLQNEVDAWL